MLAICRGVGMKAEIKMNDVLVVTELAKSYGGSQETTAIDSLPFTLGPAASEPGVDGWIRPCAFPRGLLSSRDSAVVGSTGVIGSADDRCLQGNAQGLPRCPFTISRADVEFRFEYSLPAAGHSPF
jgi:hypothetical protein